MGGIVGLRYRGNSVVNSEVKVLVEVTKEMEVTKVTEVMEMIFYLDMEFNANLKTFI